ncbi:hypothetical protein [Roseofilum casamattae]|uniref:CopG family transcriptional regulator n=1 Tax=Roseofilum casamattae BLCC-M143 TaxID=3022442 RepID=A0ABT7BZT7_9CYAN|nr:hypothetical protein [Roseofilum casamattae]MDJ1184725.1 hypothetical protein [Roseofilum casamattae BLCC-M143]
MIQLKIDDRWQDKITKIASDRQTTPEEVMQEAIALYLGEVAANSGDRLVALEQDVIILKSTVDRLRTLVTVMRQQQLNAPSNVISETSAIADIDDDDDIYDEPDEILYDFLEPS